jgi:hypothetical protein
MNLTPGCMHVQSWSTFVASTGHISKAPGFHWVPLLAVFENVYRTQRVPLGTSSETSARASVVTPRTPIAARSRERRQPSRNVLAFLYNATKSVDVFEEVVRIRKTGQRAALATIVHRRLDSTLASFADAVAERLSPNVSFPLRASQIRTTFRTTFHGGTFAGHFAGVPW